MIWQATVADWCTALIMDIKSCRLSNLMVACLNRVVLWWKTVFVCRKGDHWFKRRKVAPNRQKKSCSVGNVTVGFKWINIYLNGWTRVTIERSRAKKNGNGAERIVVGGNGERWLIWMNFVPNRWSWVKREVMGQDRRLWAQKSWQRLKGVSVDLKNLSWAKRGC